MAEELIISISGVRGIVGRSLGPGAALDYACAFGGFLRAGVTPRGGGRPSVCLGRDSRASGAMLASAIQAGLCAVGVDVVDLGLVATPSVGIMVCELGCAGGVMVTASHNPIPYNGIKLLLGNGVAPPASTAAQIRQRFLDRDFSLAASVDCGRVTDFARANDVHVEKVLAIVDREALAKRRVRVVLDSVNGAGGPVGMQLLTALGCDVVAVNDEPTGMFAHEPEPTAENLAGFCDVVAREGADVGFAQDPDADRLAIVDETGRYIGEEYTLALAAKYVFGKTTGIAAANLSTSRMIDDIATAAGGRVIRTPVGEANVAEVMLQQGCIIGGEGNGGVIDLRIGPVRDSVVAMALVLQLMAETGKSISQLVAELPAYCMCKEKFPADKVQAQRILDLASETFSGATVDTADGCRFDFTDGWVHLRVSNTEPVMRSIVEAADETAASRYCDAVGRIRDQVLG